MNKILAAALLLSLMVSFSGAKVRLAPWPADRIEHDLSFQVDDIPAPMPLEEFRKMLRDDRDFQTKLPLFPYTREVAHPNNYSLVASQSPVKNQGKRGQCHNFSTTGAMEYSVWVGQQQALNFSEQCNAWKFYYGCLFCCNNPENERDGGHPDREIFYIHDKFMKFETDYPYRSDDPAFCKKNYNDGPYFSFNDIRAYRQSLDQIKAAIDKNYVVVTSTEWKMTGWNDYGEFPFEARYPACTEETCGGHAVIIVAYDDHYYGQGKGGFIFKNSWSPLWGASNELKPAGYGVFPYSYLEQFGQRYVGVSHKNASPDPLPPKGCKKKKR